MNQIRRIDISKLEIGMYISDQSKNIADGSIQQKGLISRRETLDKLKQKQQAEFFIDVSKGKDSPFAKPVRPEKTSLKPKKSLEEERQGANKVYKEAVGLVGNLLKDVKMGNPIEVGPVESLADDINNSVLSNENALLCLSQIREKDQYLLEHSINVGILMGIFARHIGYDKETVHQLVTGALLHDLGKIRVPHQILNKPGKLDPDEWQEMQNHVIYGVEVLKKSEGISEIAMDICHLHHERLDGTGYPRKVSQDEISVYGRMAAIVDVYDAITADRVYHKGKSPAQALKLMTTFVDSHLDKELFFQFVKCMGVYPVGATVKLNNSRIGVVLANEGENLNEPLVRVFFNDRAKHYIAPEDINLAKNLSGLKIAEIVEARDYNFDVGKFLE